MSRPTKNPLTPESLATDGIQGADAKAQGPCNAEDSAAVATAAILALAATDAACAQLDRYAMATDSPAWEMVDASDLLDAARALLAQGGAS